jgi:hypothetical protein
VAVVAELGLSIGSDVPFFLGPGPAWAAGRGERHRPAAVPPLHLVLLYPRDRALAIRLEFIKPWAQVNATTFELSPEGGGTRVTWTMTGDLDFVGKLFAVFMNMDRVIGTDFEKGLARLRDTQPR